MARQARKLQKTKKPTVRVGPMAAKQIAIKGYGPEPEIGSDFSKDGYGRALNWYSTVPERMEYADIYFKELADNGYTKQDVAAAKRSVNQPTFSYWSLFSIARMMQRQIILPEQTLSFFKNRTEEIIARGYQIQEEKVAEAKEKGVIISIQERTDNKANEMFEVFDDLAEEIWTGQKVLKDIKFFEVFKTLDVKPGHARRLLERFKEEAQKYIDNPKDYSKETLKTQVPFWNSLVDATTTWANEKQAKPKTEAQLKKESVRKALSGAKKEAKAVAGLKYKQSDDSVGVVSSNPAGIIGAQEVVLFNTKYNLLTILRAKGSAGLSIKGTSIINYDESLSKTKRAGRSAATIKAMASQSKTQLKKSYDSIKGTEQEAKNRTSEEVVIVRIIK